MADGEPLAPHLPPFIPPVISPVPPVQPPAPPAQPIAPPIQPIQPAPMPQLNWFHFKPEFAGKQEENLKAHLLRTYDWMDTHAFLEGVKVHRCCLTLVGEQGYGMNHPYL